MRRFWTGLAIAISLAAITAGGVVITDDSPADPGQANIWVDSNGGTCTDGALRDYVDAEACSTFDAANDTCENGDVVRVKANAYGSQDITGSNSRSSACTIQAATGETVTTVSIWFRTTTAWITLQDIANIGGESDHNAGDCFNGSVPTVSVCVHGSDIVLDNVDVTGSDAHIDFSDGIDDVIWRNSEFGTEGNTTSVHCTPSDQQPVTISEATDLLIDNNTFWQFHGDQPGCDIHLETFRIWDGVDRFTLSNSFFAEDSGVQTAHISSSAVHNCETAGDCNKNLTFFNNVFGQLEAGHAATDIFFGDAHICEGWVIVYNFVKNGIGNNCGTELNNVAVGNMGTNPGGCTFGGTGAVNEDNLWSATSHGTCSGDAWVNGTCTSFVCDYSTYNLAANGWSLTASSPSINAGENSRCSSIAANLDIEGQTRTGVCDAGPDEYIP